MHAGSTSWDRRGERRAAGQAVQESGKPFEQPPEQQPAFGGSRALPDGLAGYAQELSNSHASLGQWQLREGLSGVFCPLEINVTNGVPVIAISRVYSNNGTSAFFESRPVD